MRSFVRLVLINAIVFVALLAAGTGVVLLIPWKGAEDTRTPAVADDGFDWLRRHFAELRDTPRTYHSYIGWRREPYSGETINIVGEYGERLTVEPPGAPPQTVFFFGGSTMWGSGSRDAETIPSQFARITGLRARNFGESAYTAHQGLEMLIKLLQGGERPAAVVFYDGVNDVVHKCRSELTYFSDVREARTRLAFAPDISSVFSYVVGKLASYFAEEDIAEKYDCDDDPEKAAAVANALVSDWRIAAAIGELYGARFYAVLQPVVYYSDTRIDHLDVDLDDERSRQYHAVYPKIRALIAGTPFRDYTDAFDGDEALYFDFAHVLPAGNAIIAARLADLVAPDILAAGASSRQP